MPAARRRRGEPVRSTRPITVNATASTAAPMPRIVSDWFELVPAESEARRAKNAMTAASRNAVPR